MASFIDIVSSVKLSGVRIESFQALSKFHEERQADKPDFNQREPGLIASALRELQYHNAMLDRADRDDHGQTLIFTAYSADYTIGALCEHVNRRYASRHGYLFTSVVDTYESMMTEIQPRQFLGWYKILMLQRFLCDPIQRHELEEKQVKWLMWIDADAIFINHDQRVEDIIAMGSGRELILGEDSSKCCLLNTGVLLIRLSDWARDLFNLVWEQRKYYDTFFYEQSALIKCLKHRHEGLEAVVPFHSYLKDGPQGAKLFPHVCVLPMHEINSNRCTLDEEDLCTDAQRECRYIFHAIGRSNKLGLLSAVLAKFDLMDGVPSVTEFKLIRGKCGGLPSPDVVEKSKEWGKKRNGHNGEL